MAAKKILFVCTGNICRSAMAEHLLRHWSKERGLDLEIRSCGTHSDSSWEMPAPARKMLVAEGVPPVSHRPTVLSREPLRWADVVFAMDRGHRDHILELYPEFTSKTKLLREEAGFGELDVDDPYGRPEAVYAACMAVLKESLTALFTK